MTREEAIEFGNMWLEINEDYKDSNTYEFFQMALKALEQEPRKGHWIEHPHEAGPCWEYSKYECSECHVWSEDDSDYCPYCGTKTNET